MWSVRDIGNYSSRLQAQGKNRANPKAEFFVAVEKPAAAALQYQLAAGASKANRTTESPAFKAIETFAVALDVEKPFGAGHRPGVVKSTPSFAGAVADFQSKSGLSPTGKLDLSTLHAAVMMEEKGQDISVRVY